MFNKLYVKIKNLIKKNYKLILFYIFLLLVVTVKLPYTISMPGGIISANDRVLVSSDNKINGTFNYAYVNEIKATIPTILISLFNDKWDIEDMNSNSNNYKEILYRNKMYLKESIDNATIVAYNKLNLKVEILSKKLIVVGDLNSNFKIGDEIKKIDNIEISNIEQFKKIVNEKEINDIVNIEVISKGNKYIRKCRIYEEKGKKIVGIILLEDKILKTDPLIEIKTETNESGPSGGLMLALTIYDKLNDEDLLNGLNIVGTGSIDSLGNIGEIGGIKYKLLGIDKNKIDLFFVPKDNYDEAIEINKKYNLKLNIISIETFEDAIAYLKSYKNNDI